MNIRTGLAGINVEISGISEEAFEVFTEFMTDSEADLHIDITEDEIDAMEKLLPSEWKRLDSELAVISGKVSDAFLPLGKVLFHGAAFVWKGKAWIFTAPSGTGKTTQYAQWKLLYGDEISLINGDKPFISIDGDEVMVYPSPWKGKEGIGNMVSAPLGGIIYLAQGPLNVINPMADEFAVQAVFRSFIYSTFTEDNVYRLGEIEERMLSFAPVWNFVNLGDMEGAKLTHDTLLEYLEGAR